MPANHANPQSDQPNTEQIAYKTSLEPCTDQHTQAERQEATTVQQILPAHKKHPLHECMQGVLGLLTTKVGFSNFIRLRQLDAGTT